MKGGSIDFCICWQLPELRHMYSQEPGFRIPWSEFPGSAADKSCMMNFMSIVCSVQNGFAWRMRVFYRARKALEDAEKQTLDDRKPDSIAALKPKVKADSTASKVTSLWLLAHEKILRLALRKVPPLLCCIYVGLWCAVQLHHSP